jgi:hypothetical protein
MASEAETTPAPVLKELTAADFRAQKERPRRTEKVEAPELGGFLYVRALTGLELDRLDDALTDDRGKPIVENTRAKYFAMCVSDAAGKALFSFTPAEVAEIGFWDGDLLNRVYDAAVRLNRRRASDRASEKKD